MSLREKVFRDRVGVTLFLGTVCFAMVYWRAGIFITDNVVLVRTLEALGDGRLWIERVDGETWFDGPGAEVRDGRVYGRNYGQLVVSLPALVLLWAIDAVADLRIALVALWHLLLLAFVVQLGHLFDRQSLANVGGSLVVLASFVSNLVVATTFFEPEIALLALQLTSLVATGLIAVVLYRLVAFQHGDRLGVLVGAASVLVLPVGFWATIPKRHVFSALVVVLVLYLFATSRNPDAETRVPLLGHVPLRRAGAYASVGYLTWIHAAEGLFVFIVLFVLDVLTAPRNDIRSVGFVACIFALSLVPTIVTNVLVTGHPARPPRTLGGSIVAPAQGTAEGVTTGGILGTLEAVPLLGSLVWLVSSVVSLVSKSLATLVDPTRVYHIFVRSAGGDVGGGLLEFAGANLSVLESAPVLAGLAPVAMIAVLKRADRRGPKAVVQTLDPTRVLAFGLVCAILAIYLWRLPLYVQINQRYILPIYPLGLFILASSPTVKAILAETRSVAIWSYAAGVLLGTQLVLAYVVHLDYAVAEAAQVNARLALVVAGFVVVTLLGTHFDERFQRSAAISIGLACAAGTIFLLISGIYYFSMTGEAVLPLVDELGRRL